MIAPKNTNDLPDEIRATVAIVESLFDKIYLVGGSVRDSILGRTSTDLDFTTPDSVDEVYAKLKNNRLFSVRDDARDFGTISASIDTFNVQITTFRDEQYSDGSRRPSISWIKDIKADLSRRDFTMNSIALSRVELIDPYGGLRDIENRIIRAIGDPLLRFKEDPLRILRAFRFVSAFGFDIETATLDAAQKLKGDVRSVSRERVGVEVRKLMEGDHWVRSLNELADSSVINVVFGYIGAPYSVKGSDIRHEFDKYSTKSLETMGLVQRWLYLIDIMHFAAGTSGITSMTKLSIGKLLVHGAQLSKKIKEDVLTAIQTLEKVPNELVSSPTNQGTEQLQDMKDSYISLKSENNPLWMIEGSNYFAEIGRQSLFENKFKLAKENYKKAIEITEKNYEYLIQWQDDEKKNQRLRAIKPYYLERLKYLYVALICDKKLFLKYDSIDSVRIYLRKQNLSKHTSKKDTDTSIDYAIARVYKMNLPTTIPDSFNDFINSPLNSLDSGEKIRLTQDSIHWQLKDKNLSPKDKARLYKKKMELSMIDEEPGKRRGLEYYDPYIDYKYNLMLTSKNIREFNTRLNEFDDAAEEYLQLMSESGSGWQGERNINLTSATAHVFALTLTKSIVEKLEISTTIVWLYRTANSKLNADRYKIYENWFRYTKALLASTSSEIQLSNLFEVLKSTKHTLKYVDPDEAYLAANRPNIIEKRELLRDSFALIAMLNSQTITDLTIKHRGIRAISFLYLDSVCDGYQAFELYKKIISKIEDQALEPVKIEDTDRGESVPQNDILGPLLTGEGETMEYKSSWSFNLDRYNVSNKKQKVSDKEVTKSAIKNIAGFMNKRGGILLIGVNDNCEPIGLENTDLLLSSSRDPRKALDNLQQDIRKDISNALGGDVFNRLSVEVIKYRDRVTVLMITVPSSDPRKPCLYKEGTNQIYFVRSGTICENAGIQALINQISTT